MKLYGMLDLAQDEGHCVLCYGVTKIVQNDAVKLIWGPV
jgi:hypothetical protein